MSVSGGADRFRSAWLRAERAWHSRSAPLGLMLAGLSVAVALAASATLKWKRTVVQDASLRVQVHSAQAALGQRASVPPAASAQIYTDFVQALPVAIDIQVTLSTLHRAAADAGVTLSSIQVQPRASTHELLARTDLTMSARGSYLKLLQMTDEVLSRYRNATLGHLSLRRSGAPEQLESTIVIGLWGAPAAVGPTASAQTAGAR